ncbi:unnamed protein product [Caenorhabditis angaria]|uniref:Uncharacterized protein n=1 Tax=Caenorhabditis angaria TaxID=860376 RepID=A0A9P1IS45_9PELO|nr:unnamed protein product [Caenorhabditis angaria]
MVLNIIGEHDDDSLDFDITASGSIVSNPLTPPPPTLRKSLCTRYQNQCAFCFMFVFVIGIIGSIILLFTNWDKIHL